MPPAEPSEPELSPAPVAVIVASDTPGLTVFTAPNPAPSLGIGGGQSASLWVPFGLALGLVFGQGGSGESDSIGVDFGPGLSPPVPGDTTGVPDFSSPPGTPGFPGLPGTPEFPPTVPGATPEPVPEPSTTVTMAALLLVSGAGILRNRRRRREGNTGRSVE
jgi:hypothetical protein